MLEDFNKLTDDCGKKEWVKPTLEVLSIKKTEDDYWEFIVSGDDFWQNNFVSFS